MTPVAPSVAMAPIAYLWHKVPSIGFWCLPQCVRRLWEYLKHYKHRGATRFKFKDWELAEELEACDGKPCGRSLVQKALRWAERLGLIRRFREWGRNGGRVIEIIINLKGPAEKPAKAKGKRKAAGQVPNVGNVEPATPEQQAAAKAAIEAAAAQADYMPTPEEEAATRSMWEEIKAKAAAMKIPMGPRKARISDEEAQQRREAAKAKTANWTFGPDGMRVPDPPDSS